ncbi:putative zinc-binding oxidoreductase ToxD [Ilyonectria destructans]|nr:putative zinc-binding oxidoreductase ToxD [Ilyonectria destructans]
MQALKSAKDHKAGLFDVPLPVPARGEVLVRTKAVALNPSDWKAITWMDTLNFTIGCDYAGIVEEVGEGVEKDWKKGDRIAGMANGNNPLHLDGGAFAEYIVVKGDVQIKIPDNIGFEEAATLGVGTATVGQGLYQKMKLPLPTAPVKEKFPILIYGGSTATGILGIQFAKLSGLEVITTCSPRNFDYVKEHGADHVFDYNSPTCGSDIRELTKNRLFYAWDCFAESPSPKVCSDALSTEKSHSGEQPIYGSLAMEGSGRDDVTSVTSMAYTIFAEPFERGPFYIPPSQEDFEFAKEFMTLIDQLLADSSFKPHRVELRSGGIGAIPEGIEDLKNYKVSGKKLVYPVEWV